MKYNQFENLSCYEEFEIQVALTGISKIDILKEIGHKINNYYFFVSSDGVFNWFDLKGNHIEEPCILKAIEQKHIPITITKCVIPNSVTSIGDNAFWRCESLKEITIPNNVTSIGNNTFYNCESLKEITIPNSVTSIGYCAFACCDSLTSITIQNSITSINSWVFSYCNSLTSITIPDSVTSISYCAFSHCASLTSITIPNNVIDICNTTFYGCNALKEVIFKGKTLEEVKQMVNYPFRIEDESIIKCDLIGI